MLIAQSMGFSANDKRYHARLRKNSAAQVLAVRALTRAWMRKDKEKMSHWLADDITEVGPAFKSPLIGKKDFFREYDAYLSGAMEILSYRMALTRTIPLSARLALVHFTYRMRTKTDEAVEESEGKESILLERIRGRWLIKFIHWHRDPAP